MRWGVIATAGPENLLAVLERTGATIRSPAGARETYSPAALSPRQSYSQWAGAHADEEGRPRPGPLMNNSGVPIRGDGLVAPEPRRPAKVCLPMARPLSGAELTELAQRM